MVAVSAEFGSMAETGRQMISTRLGIVDATAFHKAVQRIRHGQEVRLVGVMRMLAFESWLETMKDHRICEEGPGGLPVTGALPRHSLLAKRSQTTVQLAD